MKMPRPWLRHAGFRIQLAAPASAVRVRLNSSTNSAMSAGSVYAVGRKSSAPAGSSRSVSLRYRRRFFTSRSLRVSSKWLGKWLMRWWSPSRYGRSALKRCRTVPTDAQYTLYSSSAYRLGSHRCQPRRSQLVTTTSLSRSAPRRWPGGGPAACGGRRQMQ